MIRNETVREMVEKFCDERQDENWKNDIQCNKQYVYDLISGIEEVLSAEEEDTRPPWARY